MTKNYGRGGFSIITAFVSLMPGGNKEQEDEVKVDVSRLDLRVGRIIAALQYPDSDGLCVKHVDVGEAAPRTVVSELAKHIPVDQVQFYYYIITCE